MDQEIFKKRVYITGLLVLGIAFFFVYRFINLHFPDMLNISSKKEVVIKRGCIKDRNGYILALNIERDSLFANPELIENPEEAAKSLSPIIKVSEKFIYGRIMRPKRFVWLKRKLSDPIVDKIKKLELKGLHFKKEFQRVYPHGPLASNITGFVGIDNIGLEGIEYLYDDLLTGRKKISESREERDIIIGDDIKLTINRFIQYISEKEIRKGVIKFGAMRGMAVVLEVKTGRVLAIANYPNYNPNFYYNYSNDVRRNFAVVDSFEPGSTLKVIALTAILEGVPGVLKRRFQCNGRIDIADTTIRCTGRHGWVNLQEIISFSCNAGLIQVMNEVNKGKFYNTLSMFGFGKRTGIELPGESSGILRSLKRWSGLSKYSISIGQEISVTSLQIMAAMGAIANRGIYLVPRIVEAFERADGSIIQDFYPETRGRILPEEIAGKILKMMRQVVTKGTGRNAGISHYNVAGKTGTAQKPMKKGGYYPNRYIASFIGVAPYEDPDVCILVVIDEPGEADSGGEVAAPVFAGIAERILPYRGVKRKSIPSHKPLRVRYKKRKFDNSTMPDFRRLLMSESIKLLITMQKSHNVKYSFTGRGRVYKQHPSQGTVVKKNHRITLYLR